MPSKSVSQQKLFGWALACKRGEAKKCPKRVKELADSMSEEELEKFAKTSHEGLPDKVKESLEESYSLFMELAISESDEEELSEASKAGVIDTKGGTPHGESKTPQQAATSKETPKVEKEHVEHKKDGIPIQSGDPLKAAPEDPAGFTQKGKKPTAPANIDNKTDEPDKNAPVHSGMEPAKKSVIANVFTPNVHKFPMGTGKNVRKSLSFDEFLKIINYKTHDGDVQNGSGRNRNGSKVS